MSNKTQVRPIEMQLNQAICEIQVLEKALQECREKCACQMDNNLKLRMRNNELLADIRKKDAMLDEATEKFIMFNQEADRLKSMLHDGKEIQEKKSFFRRIFGL
jgi:regulator of replication initiation timing